jgi:hypothetical protein
MQATKNLYHYMISVVVALVLFSLTGLVIPGIEDKATVQYQVLLFVFTFSGVVLLFFAGSLIVTGAIRIYWLVRLLVLLSRKKIR